ncbi:hypothetical protein A5482_012345 [Cyanobacterium sp. IPPAS B-1200]|uniref:hypothetical protein n=1 Tax=Cyanobacterium sp. IPPAS B-1200 TaxID=1562720 RepID=UPI00114CC068
MTIQDYEKLGIAVKFLRRASLVVLSFMDKKYSKTEEQLKHIKIIEHNLNQLKNILDDEVCNSSLPLEYKEGKLLSDIFYGEHNVCENWENLDDLIETLNRILGEKDD